MKVAWRTGLVAAVVVATLPAQQVTLAAQPVVFGEAFELTVTTERAFDEARLLPLVVELLSRTPAGNGEQLRFRARCYELGEVKLLLEPPQVVRVVSSLPEPAGELEWPGDGWQLQQGDGSRWLIWGSLGLAVLAAGTWWWLRGKVQGEPAPSLPVEPPWDALVALRELTDDGVTGDAFYLQLKAIVRKHCAQRFHLPAEVRTSEELLQALPRAQPSLQPCLMTCDVVLFGGAAGAEIRLAEADRFGARDYAIQFITATQVASRRLEVGT